MAKKKAAKKKAAKKKAAPKKKAAAKKKTAKKAAKKKTAKKKPAAKKKAAKKKGKKVKRKPNPSFMRPLQPNAHLGAVVGSKPLPRTQVVKKLWAYIKKNNLQLPKLPYGNTYEYDVANHKLVVVKAEKKANTATKK